MILNQLMEICINIDWRIGKCRDGEDGEKESECGNRSKKVRMRF